MTSPDTHVEKRICIGKINSAHGVKGLVKILPYCEDISLLSGKLFIGETGADTLTITVKNSMGKFVLAQIDGVTTPEVAKTLKHELYIPRSDLADISEGDGYYIEDLLGINAIDENQNKIGKVISVPDFGAGDLLEIKPKSGPTYYIPLLHEAVGDVDLEAKTVTISNAEQFIIK